VIPVSRLKLKLSRNGFGNALSEPQLRRLYGGRWSGPNAGVVIDGVIWPVQVNRHVRRRTAGVSSPAPNLESLTRWAPHPAHRALGHPDTGVTGGLNEIMTGGSWPAAVTNILGMTQPQIDLWSQSNVLVRPDEP
jgi:hypothetical protein